MSTEAAIGKLEQQAAHHKKEMRRHRRELAETMQSLAQLKQRLEALGVDTSGVAIGDDSHGLDKETGA